MSPLTPRDTPDAHLAHATLKNDILTRPLANLEDDVARLDPAEVRVWTPSQVADWMHESGFDDDVIEKFESNDISGAVLLGLRFDDLKELDIPSFGKRQQLWSKLHDFRRSLEPEPSDEQRTIRGECSDEEEPPRTVKKKKSRKLRKKMNENPISPLESVSIVGIEQLMPKPHKCAKGENCSKFRRQERQRAMLAQEYPVSPEGGGYIFVAGNPGNALIADNMRPTSEAEPSVVASSDVLGQSQLPQWAVDEEALRNMPPRDPQENVKQFLDLQRVQNYVPESPPALEMFPNLEGNKTSINMQSLPKLSIPDLPQRSMSAMSPGRNFSPIDAITALSPQNTMNSLNTMTSPLNQYSPRRSMALSVYRQGTPASEMDIPVTAVSAGPVARDTSQSVPPDMRYRPGSLSRRPSSRMHCARPSFQISKVDEENVWEAEDADQVGPSSNDYNHAGFMKKRKTKLLRHEWQEHHFRLTGTELAMHKDELTKEQLEKIDVEDFAVACSSIASNKLSAAFKQMKIAGKKKDGEDGAFSFQLVPSVEKRGPRQAATSKTHHFAVKSRDERIDWMRELMLAKALKQRDEACEVGVNGSAV